MSSLEKARWQIDQQLAIVHHTERELLSRRNAFTFACALPPELLSLIFLRYVDPFADQTLDRRGLLALIKVTHVCRHWRAVALACPALWTRLNFCSIEWTKEMIQRSKQAPLIVSVDLSFKAPARTALEEAVRELPRIRQFRLRSSTNIAQEFIERLTSPAPLLESLLIDNNTFSPYNSSARDQTVTIPRSFLSHTAPALRKLALWRCDFSWDMPLLKGLTELDLSWISTAARPSNGQLLHALRNMPALKKLTLRDTLPMSTDMAEGVHLPELQQLHVYGSPFECSQFLSYLTFPEAIKITLNCLTDDEDFSSIVPFLAIKCFPPNRGKEAREVLHISGADPSSIRIQSGLPTLGNSSSYTGMKFEWRVTIQLNWFQSTLSAINVLRSIISHLDLVAMRIVQIQDLDCVSQDFWRALLTSTSAATILDVDCINYSSVTDLVKVFHPGVGVPCKDILLPHLDQLVLSHTEFNDTGDNVPSMHPNLNVNVLYDCLMARANHGVSLHRLIVWECYNFTADNKRFLGEVVPYVQWDGIYMALRTPEPSEEDDSEVESGEDDFAPFDDSDGSDSDDIDLDDDF
ncbi:hypothetical protein CONPUDRAFT_107669 [Coniophora puteana RWD-64-598 SS2]|uniref:F-box domain-containing protein n=1 Tax=Coniophora puteana (strain RWD-64-598) TaxID=741705 RepID=A0A5M3ML13_CONPW|nr:uncharacterized protein CONPUDRAFT_107669 [Coniophora puteana RWD-64-598 SS2]EIW79355.1 hypothetical protein CONPUDRAFT_107669 [Coniophora puteana RWD-64-598 SS2]